MSNKIICPICFSKNFSLYGKDKDGYQKYICKSPTCKRQFIIAKYFSDTKSFKISHVSIYKWIKGFGAIFKELTEKYIPKDLNTSTKLLVD